MNLLRFQRCLSTKTAASLPRSQQPKVVYEGGLAKAAKVMKLASVASFVGASAAIPFFFTGDSDIPAGARTILAITTLGMTGSSTALVAWALKPYITSIKALDNTPSSPLLIETLTFLAQPRTRLVFRQQLQPAAMPLTSWTTTSPTPAQKQAAHDILTQLNTGRRKRDLVQLAQEGHSFYAHIQGGQLTSEMQKIVDEYHVKDE